MTSDKPIPDDIRPSDKHMEKAQEIISFAFGREGFRYSAVAVDIAAALAAAEREGMKRAAEIASEFDDEDILLGKDVAEIIRNTILSEAWEGE